MWLLMLPFRRGLIGLTGVGDGGSGRLTQPGSG